MMVPSGQLEAKMFRAEPPDLLRWVDRVWSFDDPGDEQRLVAMLENLWTVRDDLVAGGDPLVDGDVVVMGWGAPWVRAFEFGQGMFTPVELPQLSRVVNSDEVR